MKRNLIAALRREFPDVPISPDDSSHWLVASKFFLLLAQILLTHASIQCAGSSGELAPSNWKYLYRFVRSGPLLMVNGVSRMANSTISRAETDSDLVVPPLSPQSSAPVSPKAKTLNSTKRE